MQKIKMFVHVLTEAGFKQLETLQPGTLRFENAGQNVYAEVLREANEEFTRVCISGYNITSSIMFDPRKLKTLIETYLKTKEQ